LASNIEIKAKLPKSEFSRILGEAARTATQPPQVLQQTDTFFVVPHGRLKLREFDRGTAELIAYCREDSEQPTRSNYSRVAVENPDELKQTMGRMLGIRGVVQKRRDLFLVHSTRIHLDTVTGLGRFLEIEVVLDDEAGDQAGKAMAEQLMVRLGIASDWLISRAYIDLLETESVS
jgi:predicted adenylyl cyclase CyaB